MGDTSAKTKARMHEQDIAKGIAILIVVFVHSVQLRTGAMDWLVATTGYAMPFFFFVSGYNYRPGKGSWGQNVAKRARQLLLPLLGYSLAVYLIMWIYFAVRQEATLTEGLRSFASLWLSRSLAQKVGLAVEMSSPFGSLMVQAWFLQFMMTGYLIFYFVADYALENCGRFISVNFALLCVTCLFVHREITLPWGLHAAPLVASMMLFGALFGQKKLLHKGTIPTRWNALNTLAAFGIYLTFGLAFPKAGQFAGGMLGHGIGYWDVYVTLLAAILGSYVLVNVSKVVEKVKPLGGALRWCGENSLPILLLHTSFIKVFSNMLHVQRAPMGAQIEQTDWTTVLVCALSILCTAALIPVIKAGKKLICGGKKKHEGT